MSVVVTYWTDVMFYEETVSTKWNHEQHDETMSMEGTTIQRYSESKFMIMPNSKVALFMYPT